jgi:hypothetical protein
MVLSIYSGKIKVHKLSLKIITLLMFLYLGVIFIAPFLCVFICIRVLFNDPVRCLCNGFVAAVTAHK